MPPVLWPWKTLSPSAMSAGVVAVVAVPATAPAADPPTVGAPADVVSTRSLVPPPHAAIDVTRSASRVRSRDCIIWKLRPSGLKCLREAITGGLAPMARFGADAVVLVMRRVALTLRAAHATRFGARGHLRA